MMYLKKVKMLRNKSSREYQHWDVLIINFSDVNLYHRDENKLKDADVILNFFK